MAKVHAAPSAIAFHMLIIFSGCSTESPMQGFLFFFFLSFFNIESLAFSLSLHQDYLWNFAEAFKKAAPRDRDFGRPDLCICVKSSRRFRGIKFRNFSWICFALPIFVRVNLFFVTKFLGAKVSLEYFIFQHLHCQ